MRRCAIAVAAAVLAAASPAGAYDHVARAGETLDQLAMSYYGALKHSMTIRAANGFLHPDDGRLIEGEHVEIPEVTYYRVQTGDTWETIANKYLGTVRRGRFLAEMNAELPGSALVEGQIVKVPYQLLYVLAPDETLKSVAAQYLGTSFTAEWLRDYNLFKKKKSLGRGDALLVPLVNVEMTPEGKARVRAAEPRGSTEEDRDLQAGAAREIAALREDYAAGRFLRVVAKASLLLGAGKLTVPQQVGVAKFLASAYVAFGDREAAVAAFAAAIAKQPDMELSPITTSPKILDAFREAQKRAAAAGK
jgi:hypothetical protein